MSITCPQCGEEVEAVDLDNHADEYYCECGWCLCDCEGWLSRKIDYADNLRKAKKEGL